MTTQDMATGSSFIDGALERISWKTIHDYYTATEIKWKFTSPDGEGTVHRVPTVDELRSDLVNAINFVFQRNMPSMDYGNWVIFWTDDKSAYQLGLKGPQLEVLFVLSGALIKHNEEMKSSDVSIQSLKTSLDAAIHDENYELAKRIKEQLEALGS